MTDVISRHVRISGAVQGVGFRAWTARNANELGLAGWVRNLADGTVEAVFRGPSSDVDEMLRRCALGPRHANVSSVNVLDPRDSRVGHRQAGDDDRRPDAGDGARPDDNGFVVRR